MAHVSKTLAHKTAAFPKREQTNYIVVHCADTPPKMDVGVNDIRQWHIARGWKDVGYHYVIRRSGLIESGRHFSVTGAHVQGHNKDSVGLCLVGRERNYTDAQWESLAHAVNQLSKYFKGAKVVGHSDLDRLKKPHCPGFDVPAWWAAYQSGIMDQARAFDNIA